jgi:predicted methyltransferase
MLEEKKTRDGSITYFNTQVGDAYHSVTVGAIEEAIEKYVKPTKIKDGMRVLDFCFGLGYNSLAVLIEKKKVEIVGLENDDDYIDWREKNILYYM